MLTSLLFFVEYPLMVLDTMLTTGPSKDWACGAGPALCSHNIYVGLRNVVENAERDLGATNIVEFSGRLGFNISCYQNRCEVSL